MYCIIITVIIIIVIIIIIIIIIIIFVIIIYFEAESVLNTVLKSAYKYPDTRKQNDDVNFSLERGY